MGVEVEFFWGTGVFLAAVAFFANFVKAVTGFGGGFLFISLIRAAEVLGLQGLGAYSNAVVLVTTMEIVTTWPFAISQIGGADIPVMTTLIASNAPFVPLGAWVLTLGDSSATVANYCQRSFGAILVCFAVLKFISEIKAYRQGRQGTRDPLQTPRPSESVPSTPRDDIANDVEAYSVEMTEQSTDDVSDVKTSVGADGNTVDGAVVTDESDTQAMIETKSDPKPLPAVPVLQQLRGCFSTPAQRNMILKAIVAGVLSGFMGGLFGAGGPPIMVFFAMVSLSKTAMRSTGLMTYSASLFCRVISLVFAGMINFTTSWPYYLLVTPSGVLGTVVGHKMHAMVSERWIRAAILAMLIGAGGMLLAVG